MQCPAERNREGGPGASRYAQGRHAERYLAFLKRVFTAAQDDGLVDRNPVRRVKLVREPAARIRWLSDEEERAVIPRLDERDQALVQLAMCTGLRQGEQWCLWWSDVSLGRTLFVADAKYGGSRWVPLNKGAQAALRALERQGSHLICPGSADRAARRFAKACLAAGIAGFHWHDLRHAFASRLVIVGVAIKTGQELLGHKAFAMTMRYAHLAPGHLHEAVAKLDGVETATKQPPRRRRVAGKVVALEGARRERKTNSNV